MAVLKRGDNVDSFRLYDSRTFASSFIYSWNFIFRKSKILLSTGWIACLLSGVVGVVWLFVCSRSVFWKVDISEILSDCVAGCLILLLWSVMRHQQLALVDEDIERKGSVSSFRSFLNNVKPSLGGWCCLCVAWVATYILSYILIVKDVEAYYLYPAIIVCLLVFFPVAGMIQSWHEVAGGSFLKNVRKGVELCVNYWGGIASLFVISSLLLVILVFFLFFGEIIFEVLFINQKESVFIGEPIEVPFYVVLFRYAVAFITMAVLSFFQIFWSIPQQVHIYSIAYKDKIRRSNK